MEALLFNYHRLISQSDLCRNGKPFHYTMKPHIKAVIKAIMITITTWT